MKLKPFSKVIESNVFGKIYERKQEVVDYKCNNPITAYRSSVDMLYWSAHTKITNDFIIDM
jgi:hypothetical protein